MSELKPCPFCGGKAKINAQPKNEPLTLDELRKMYSEPVYVKSLLDGQILGALIHNQNAAVYAFNGVKWDTFEFYGETWLAYRYKPDSAKKEDKL